MGALERAVCCTSRHVINTRACIAEDEAEDEEALERELAQSTTSTTVFEAWIQSGLDVMETDDGMTWVRAGPTD
jgi:hypothetical protein